MDLVILDFWILASRVRVRVHRPVCVRACRRRRRRRRVGGGGCASIGVRACLRFIGVQKRLIGEQKGQFQGCLFAGNITGAE
jgi:hypothetical protein